jgi:hypothetical protein
MGVHRLRADERPSARRAALRVELHGSPQHRPPAHLLEKRLDQQISGVRRDDGGIEWRFSRKRQIGLGL